MLTVIIGVLLVCSLYIGGIAFTDTMSHAYMWPRQRTALYTILWATAVVLVAALAGSMTPVLWATRLYYACFGAVGAHQGAHAMQDHDHVQQPLLMIPVHLLLNILWSWL